MGEEPSARPHMYLLANAKSTIALLLEKVTKNNSKCGMVFLFFLVTKIGQISGSISVKKRSDIYANSNIANGEREYTAQ